MFPGSTEPVLSVRENEPDGGEEEESEAQIENILESRWFSLDYMWL